MKRPYKRIISTILVCAMIALSVIGATAAHTERMNDADTLNNTRCGNRSIGCPPNNAIRGSGLYQILRQLGCSEELCQTILNQLGGCGLYKSDCEQGDLCAPQPTQPVPTEEVIPTETPTQPSDSIPATTPTEQAANAPTEAPTEPATELPPDPTEPVTSPATEAPVPTQAPTEEAAEPQQTQALSAYELEIVRLINEIRTQYGLGQLTVNKELSRVARIKSQDMRDKGYFSHTSPTYGSPFDMMKRFGIRYRTAGENIAMGYRTPQSVVNGWMNSPGHRANILNGSFKEIGMGYVESGNYWTQMFIG